MADTDSGVESTASASTSTTSIDQVGFFSIKISQGNT